MLHQNKLSPLKGESHCRYCSLSFPTIYDALGLKGAGCRSTYENGSVNAHIYPPLRKKNLEPSPYNSLIKQSCAVQSGCHHGVRRIGKFKDPHPAKGNDSHAPLYQENCDKNVFANVKQKCILVLRQGRLPAQENTIDSNQKRHSDFEGHGRNDGIDLRSGVRKIIICAPLPFLFDSIAQLQHAQQSSSNVDPGRYPWWLPLKICCSPIYISLYQSISFYIY